MISIILLYILLNILAGILGFKEGILYSRKASEAFKWDEHLVFIIERGLIFFIIIFYSFLIVKDAIILSILWIFSFSFFHNGMYYVSRHLIDVPKYHFTGEADTGSPILELTYKKRLCLFILSLIGLIIYLIYFR